MNEGSFGAPESSSIKIARFVGRCTRAAGSIPNNENLAICGGAESRRAPRRCQSVSERSGTPVRVKKTRQIKNPELRFDLIEMAACHVAARTLRTSGTHINDETTMPSLAK